MDDHFLSVLLDIALVFGIAGLAVPLFQRLRLSPVLGYLFCGLFLGAVNGGLLGDMPWLETATIANMSVARTLGELGVIALMFMIGLELSLTRLMEIKHYVLGLGTAQILLTTLIICLVALMFGNRLEVAILVGASLALSSTAVVMQLLEERRMMQGAVGTLAFSILLMQDLAVVPILVMINVFSGGEGGNVALALLASLGTAIVAVGGMIVLGRKLMRPMFRHLSLARNPEWLLSLTLFLVVMAAVITQASGLSAALGAFLAGLVIAETEYHKQVESVIAPLKGLLMGIFFLSVGMMIDLTEVWRTPGWLALSIIGIWVIKATVLFPLCLLFKVPARRAAEVSVMLAQGGEFAFVVLGMAWATGLMPREHAQFFLLVTALSMAAAPLSFRVAPAVGRWFRKEA